MKNKIKIVLVDDHALVMKGFTNLLAKNTGFKIVGEATSSLEALEIVKKQKPNIVLMDINMPNETGIECARKIVKSYPDSKIIMLTMHNDEQYILKALSVGAKGYVMKNCEFEELIQAIHEVNTGNEYFGKGIDPATIDEIKQKLSENSNETEFTELTKREIQIIKAISQGWSNKEISDKLYISDRTVNTHRTNIMAKMKVKNSVELAVKAIRENLI
jgi:two-component system, NarL family, response regulator DegU